MRCRFILPPPTLAVVSETLPEPHGVAVYRDAERAFAGVYGREEMAFLVRPDGYVGWRGRSWLSEGLTAYLSRISGPA